MLFRSDTESELRQLTEKKRRIENSRCDVSGMNQEWFEIKTNLENTERAIASCRQQIVAFNNHIEYESKIADTLRKEWHEVNGKQYTDSGICPTCGQALPTEQIETAKAKFNANRAEQLELITEKGKKAKEEIKNVEKLRIAEAGKIDSLQAKADEYTSEINRITAVIEKTKAEFEDFKLKELIAINEYIAEAEKKAHNSTDDIQSKIYPIQEQIATEKAKLAEIDKAIASRDLAERQKQRIAELSADEKRLAGEYAELDKIAFLVDKFTKYKVDLLSEEINGHFQYAKFKLFEEQINGGIAECCEVCYKGVPYSDLNNASKINTGLDIINTLCRLNDKYATVIVDNSESITNILPTTSQMICLVVSAGDDALRVEKGV